MKGRLCREQYKPSYKIRVVCKNAYKKRKNEKFEKQKKCVQESLIPNIKFLGQNVYSVARVQTDRHTDRQTDTKVNTEGTLSGFQDFCLFHIVNWLGF